MLFRQTLTSICASLNSSINAHNIYQIRNSSKPIIKTDVIKFKTYSCSSATDRGKCARLISSCPILISQPKCMFHQTLSNTNRKTVYVISTTCSIGNHSSFQIFLQTISYKFKFFNLPKNLASFKKLLLQFLNL